MGRIARSMYIHKISQMEKVMPSFEYEPLILSLEPKTANEDENKGDTNGARPRYTSSKRARRP